MYTFPCAGIWLAGSSARGFCHIRTAREEAEYRVRSTTSSLSMSARPATMDHVSCKLVPAGVCTTCKICRRCVTVPDTVRSFILTDDQSIAMDPAGLPLGDMQPMKRTRELLLDGGIYMENCTLNHCNRGI